MSRRGHVVKNLNLLMMEKVKRSDMRLTLLRMNEARVFVGSSRKPQ
jgi:hypothetical protein